MANSPPKTLRLRSFAITNYRTFHERTEIDFTGDVTVFHGETGSGKSTALAALDVFMRTVAGALVSGWGNPRAFQWERVLDSLGRNEPLLGERDRPDSGSPTLFEAQFEGSPKSLWVRFVPNGPNFEFSVDTGLLGQELDRRLPEDLVQRLFPFGSTSRPLAILDARRRPRWLSPNQSASVLAPQLASELYALRVSKVAADRDRWRSFASTVASFPTLVGSTISIEASGPTSPPELVVEHQGRVVLGFSELSSGEQELVALTAGLLLAKAPIVAVEEPEMGLDPKTQGIWREVCEKQLAAGFVHQFIFESHAVTFDGDHVVRFRRDSSTAPTRVERVVARADDSLSQKAREKGAAQAFVTAEGYTQLPENMRREVGVAENGAHVWFLRGVDAWEAWPEAELEQLLKEPRE